MIGRDKKEAAMKRFRETKKLSETAQEFSVSASALHNWLAEAGDLERSFPSIEDRKDKILAFCDSRNRVTVDDVYEAFCKNYVSKTTVYYALKNWGVEVARKPGSGRKPKGARTETRE